MNAGRFGFGRTARRLGIILGVVLLVGLVACGGDDDADGGDDQATADPTSASTSAGGSGGGNDGAAGSSSGSITTDFLTRFFGLPASFVTDGQRECMDAALAPDFPDGLPDDAVFNDDLVETIDTAAASCGVGNLR